MLTWYTLNKEVTSSVKLLNIEIDKETKEIASEDKRRQGIEKNISKTLEENFYLKMLNDESYKIIQKVRNKITQKYQNYEKDLDSLFIYKQAIKKRVNDEIKINCNFNSRALEFGRAFKSQKTQRYTNKVTTNNYQIDCLQQIVENENNRANQRLEIVREKTKILKQLINYEDFAKNTSEGIEINKGIWNLINN